MSAPTPTSNPAPIVAPTTENAGSKREHADGKNVPASPEEHKDKKPRVHKPHDYTKYHVSTLFELIATESDAANRSSM
jgi:hypothetical protein